MKQFVDLTGKVFHRLTVLNYVGVNNHRKRLWLCQCSCGKQTTVIASQLRTGKTKSCGCLQLDYATKHGGADTKEYQCWADMKGRCDNPNNPYYGDYGGRGISYCDRWMSYENFFQDMGKKPKGLSLDRIDNNSHYSPENCRWATLSTQARNTRKKKDTTSKYKGVCWVTRDSRWQAAIKLEGKGKYLGQFRSEKAGSINV